MEGQKTRRPVKLPCGIIVCENCNTCIFRHYALTEGRCWNCKVRLREKQLGKKGGGI